MERMKLNIQMFAPDIRTVNINVNFKDISEDELPANLIIALDTWEVTIPISGLYTNYVWNHQGTFVFDTISIVTEGYSIIAYQQGNGFIDIDVYKNYSFVKKILEDNTINQTTPDFSQVATTDEGMFTAEDNDGVSTYFRGAVTNNYVKFANFWWRIIRVNGNGSVRLIYDGTTAHANGESSTDRRIGENVFNTNSKDNAYVGYMYGTPGSTTYEETHANVNNSEIKTILDSWYESNLSDYTNYIDTEAGFWGDRALSSGSGTGTIQTYYTAYNRLYTNKTPSFEYTNNSDLYTTAGSEDGNKALQYLIGLISADEIAYAGGVFNRSNSSYYLYTNGAYWTLSPYYFSIGNARVFYVNPYGILGSTYVNNSYGVRPVINLRGDLSVTGTGTSMDPYEVSLPAVPITNFNGTELTNIYYNGTEISKMYCNGVLVFEKGPAVYKRRIMEGDNLNSKTIYFDFPNDYNLDRDTTEWNFVIMCNSNFMIYDRVQQEKTYVKIEGTYSFDTIYDPDQNINLKEYHVNENIPVSLNVSSVTECESYRHCYIEDPNIRPIQVGDKIIEGTQLYFNFPDNPDSWLTGKYDCVVIKCGDEIIMDYATEQPVSRAVSAISFISLESNDMYAFDLNTLEISRNLSSYIIKFYYQDAVSYVDDEFQQYILVNTTTLGV